ncbi:cytochrome p450, partial [Moniliophthora roreri MCA 2997]
MSFALPIQLLSHCQLLITTATGSCNKKASFELRPLEFEKPGTSRPLPTSIYVRVIETPEGTVFELSGNDPPLATSPDQLATPSDYSLPPAYEADVRSNFDFENESYRGLDADIDRWINGLPTDGQRGYSALSFAELCTPEAAGFSDPPDGSSSSQVGYGDENGDNQGNSHTLPKKDVHYQTDAWGTAAIPSPLESIDQPDNSTTTSPGPSEHSSLDDDFSKKSDKGKRPTNSKKRQTQHRPRQSKDRAINCLLSDTEASHGFSYPQRLPSNGKGFHLQPVEICFLAALIASVLIIRQVFSRPKGSLPPGPKGLPVVGNLFQLSQEAWHTFTEWKKQYGDLVYINVAGQDIVILNSHKVAADLLDRRGPIYSNRPRWIVASEILTGGLLVVFTQYNDVWRRMRRAGHEGLNKTVAASFQVPQYREAISLVDGMIKRPQLWNAEIRRATASMVWSVVYDKEPITDVMDPQVAAVNDFITRIVRAAFPGAHYVEYFTWMKHLPSWMAKWKRDAEEWYKRDSEMFEGLFLEAKQRVKSGEDRPSFAANLVRDTERHGLSDRESAWLAAALYAAGAETTAGVLSWFMLAMVLYPDVQKKIHKELDAVVGRDRMPTFADLDRLHYVQATVREALRWHP